MNTLSQTVKLFMTIVMIFISTYTSSAEIKKQRARDLGIPFIGETGPLNAITDVSGVEVGHVTIIKGDGKLVVGKGPVRTGVTAIHPRGKNSLSPVFGGWFTLNASGEMTGTTWLEERGLIDGPILITNTHSVGVVRDAAVAWMVDKKWPADWHAPIIAETYDGSLNDINGFHVTKEHALEALSIASSGIVEEGSVGGGTGMFCNSFKGGIGTSSRKIKVDNKNYTLGVLVQCNYGGYDFILGGTSIFNKIGRGSHCYTDRSIERKFSEVPYCDDVAKKESIIKSKRDGSIIIVVATDAPLLPHQLKRLAKRPSLAIGKLGGYSHNGSGDIFLAFSTAANNKLSEDNYSEIEMYPNNQLYFIFEAAVNATEEAIVNAMVAADTMIAVDGLRIEALPEDKIKKIMMQKK